MKIKTIEFPNFKSFENRKVSLSPKLTEISGRNGSGKSGIRDGVIFALYNSTYWGGKETDKFINEKRKNPAEVILEIDDKKIYRKKSKSATSFKIDDKNVTQKDFEERFYSFDIFSTVFNTEYFLNLPESKQREVFLEIVPDIDKNEAFLEMGYNKYLLEKYALDLNSPESVDAIKATIKDLEKNATEQETKLEIKEASRDSHYENIKEYIEEYGVIDRHDNSSSEKSILKEIDKKIEKKETELLEAKELYNKYQDHESYLKNLEYYDKVSSAFNDKKKRLEELNDTLKEDNEKKATNHIEKLEKELTLDKYSVPPVPTKSECPTCLTRINPKKKEEIINQIEQRRQERNAVELSLEKSKETLAEIINLRQEKEFIEKELASVPEKPKKIEKPKEVRPDIDKVQEELTSLREERHEKYSYRKYIMEEHDKYQEDRKDAKSIKGKIKEIQEMKKDMDVVKEAINPSKLNAFSAKKQVSSVENKLKELLPNNEVQIVVQEDLKSGMGFKEVFRINIDRIDYRNLSTGEQKILGVAVSKTFNSLLEEKISVFFVDNFEHLSEKNRFNLQLMDLFEDEDQIIYTFVEKTKPLNIIKHE